ncbi:ATP-binding cassette domain-containing protein [Aquitalea pelogenes]|uniref:ATP-binding cassette domain-containing protein n=1 Tax=Aquitalea pelogenes TaxID=1293573 RepID=UPI000ADAF434|nr:ATP-binding cassette domain-containing protein [Aquitalea pelogenes]
MTTPRFDLSIRHTLHSGQRSFSLNIALQSSCQQLVVYGPSGAGKSLLLKAIAGLHRPDAGHIRLDGRSLFDSAQGICLSPQQRQLGYLFQDYALFPHLSVRQNIGFGLQRGWLNPGRRRQLEAVDYWLEAFGLQSLADQLPATLSGGQRQRTALARAWWPSRVHCCWTNRSPRWTRRYVSNYAASWPSCCSACPSPCC